MGDWFNEDCVYMYIYMSRFDFFTFPFLQGSYGIVKLAYNEQDDVHYVSIKPSIRS